MGGWDWEVEAESSWTKGGSSGPTKHEGGSAVDWLFAHDADLTNMLRSNESAASNDTYNPFITVDVTERMPAAYDAQENGNAIAMEKITIAHEGFELMI